jgi:ATP/maltotriose-dependent transcriptional regulator MalT
MDRSTLLVRAARTASHAGDPAQASAMVESALTLLPEQTQPETRALVLERLGGHRAAIGDVAGSQQAHQAAVDLLAERPPSEAKALCIASLGRRQMLMGRFADAEATLREAMTVNAKIGSPAVQVSALCNLGAALVQAGRIDDGMTTLRQALDLAEHAGRADDIGSAYLALTGAFIVAARYREAADLASTGVDYARRVGMEASLGSRLACNWAWALVSLGQWEQAAELLSAAASRSGENGAHAAGIAARLALWRGRAGDASDYCERALQAPDGHLAGPERLAFAADIACAEGAFARARELAQQALAVLEPSDDLWLTTQVLASAMQVEADRVDAAPIRGQRADDIDEARAVADDLLSRVQMSAERLSGSTSNALPEARAWLDVARADHGRAWGRSDPDSWASAAAQFEALSIPYPGAVARFREADAVLRARGSRPRATDAARSAFVTATRLGAEGLVSQIQLLAQRARLDLADTPASNPADNPTNSAMPDEGWRQLGISPREAEVLALLARGRSNHEIAKELFISEKTASVHVTHLLRKLAVTSRVEAAAIGQRIGMGA